MEKLREYAEEKEQFLKSHGIWYMVGFPVRWWLYVLVKLLFSGFAGACAASLFEMKLPYAFALMAVFYFGADVLVNLSNDNDNLDMLTDIKVLFDCLRIQVKAGVYITDAITEIIPLVANKRLKRAMTALSDSITLTNNIDSSLTQFNELFCNRHIDTVVIILRQALISGQSAESLDNAFEQMTDIEQALNIKLENGLERKVMLIQVMVLFGILLAAGFCCIREFAGLFSAVK